MRTLVDIPDNEVEALASICAEEKVSRAEIIRRAIRDYIAKKSPGAIDAFGLWKEESESLDGMEYQEKIRSEW
jgi:hypothetical protein